MGPIQVMERAKREVSKVARMSRLKMCGWALSVATLVGCGGARAGEAPGAVEARVRRVLDATPLIDGHNDAPWQYRSRVKNQVSKLDFGGDLTGLDPMMHTDLPRMRAGGMGGQFWSVFVPVRLEGADAVQATLEQIDVVHRLIARHPDALALALTADDIEAAHREKKIASLIGMEGGHSTRRPEPIR